MTFDVDQIGDSDDDILVEDWELHWDPTQEQKPDLNFAHDNSGHPSRADFARLLRRGNVDPKAARWVKKSFSCEICEANKRPAPRRPVAIPESYRVNHVVGIELIYAKNLTGVPYLCPQLVSLGVQGILASTIRNIAKRSRLTFASRHQDALPIGSWNPSRCS